MANTIAIYIKDDFYYCVSTARNSLRISVLVEPISKFGPLHSSDDREIGENINALLDRPEIKMTDEELRAVGFGNGLTKLGFKSVPQFVRGALHAAVGLQGSDVFMQPGIRRRTQFEYMSPIYSAGRAPEEVGKTFRSALALCK